MRDYISDRRATVIKECRKVVLLEYSHQAAALDATTRQGFYATLLQDHAVLSPDPSAVSIHLNFFSIVNILAAGLWQVDKYSRH
jgi:hypothetical protein